MARNYDLEDNGFTARFKRQQGGVFSEDKEILEAQQKAIEANPDLKLAAYRIDEGDVQFRQIISRVIKYSFCIGRVKLLADERGDKSVG